MSQSTLEHARQLDANDELRHLRDQFIIPSRGDLHRDTASRKDTVNEGDDELSIYLCGNSLGVQPKLTEKYMRQYLSTWATKGVYGHFKEVNDTNLVPWLHVDDDLVEDMANVVGALPSEVAVMQTLTANLHLMMASFYRPTQERHRIILEGKAFPSDHYAVESHLRHHGLDPRESMVLIEPESKASPVLPTDYVLSIIDKYADSTALLLLPGVQFYSGQLFDIPTITRHAQSKGITVGWDLAHAAGNVPLQLHDWNVDFAVWCTYKYLNCGPGSIGACFVHDKHGQVEEVQTGNDVAFNYRPRLAGWWASSKSSRFAMTNQFHPIPGAAGFQLSNPSVADTTAVRASLDVFRQTSMAKLRQKSMTLTQYLEELLTQLATEQARANGQSAFTIITPNDPEQRGAQLSLMLTPGLLDSVMESLEADAVVVDERRPDVIRVAPAPLYNNHEDVYRFVQAFGSALANAVAGKGEQSRSVMGEGGREDKGWSEIK